jgi:hypothetical protein
MPGVALGAMKAVMPRGEPDLPDVRAKMRKWVAEWVPVCHFLFPLMLKPGEPSASLHLG